MRVKYWLILLFSSLLSFQLSVAQNVYAQVSSKKVQVGVPFEYAIVIGVNATNFTPPSLNDFDVVSGPNQSNSVQYVNGVMSQQTIISYALVARKEGKLRIGPASVASGNQRYETQAVVVEAVKGAVSASGASEAERSSKVSGEDIFIRTTVSKSKCYIGEQLTIIQKVYSRHQIIGYQKSIPPSYDGFYSQALESPTKGQLLTENLDGVNYYTHELFRTQATANKSGRIVLSKVEVIPIIRRQGSAKPRNIFEQFFGAASYEDMPVVVSSRPMSIEVMPLPEEGKPAGFNGAVGNFTSRVEVSRNELKANEAFNLKLTVSGKGNIKLINAPKLQLPESFESYEPKVSENGGSKTFDYLVIPRSAGDYTLTGIDFSFFNLDTKKYVTQPSADIRIKVLPPDPNSSGTQVYVSQNQVRETENDIRYIKKGNFALSRTESEFFNSAGHLALLLFPVSALGAALLIRRNHIKNNSDQVLVRERKAGRMARNQLRRAEQLMKENKKDEFYMEILTALNNYLSYKLNIPIADLSRDRVALSLTRRQVDEDLKNKLLSAIETSEYARYAPGAVSGDLKLVYDDSVRLVTSLEQQLNKKMV